MIISYCYCLAWIELNVIDWSNTMLNFLKAVEVKVMEEIYEAHAYQWEGVPCKPVLFGLLYSFLSLLVVFVPIRC